ncbi:DNA-binding CsgD family transcriptional regulator [Arthrobacter sp. AG258]|uniref:helix-turn-helix transcriptional regulator n=1 Tax=Micrococcaceae TaxID=1268 RepID=UPI00105B8BFC|nr:MULTISPECIES: LuxR family transcriptional regulator [Micrococcaceae]TDT75899.1 DNA-binding CsgD family transcriptional regulator [Arthrobacter sp. AG258]
MTKGWAADRSQERIRLLAGSDLDHQALRTAILAEVATMVPFDAFVWPLCDPVTTVGMAPRARTPCPQELPTLIRLKYLSRAGRWTELMRWPEPAESLLKATQGEPSRSPVWSGVLQRYGVRDVLSAVFADKYGCWAWLDLWRTGDSVPFTDEESAYLGELAAVVTAGLRRSVARQFWIRPDPEPGPDQASGTGSGQPGLPEQAVLTLDDDLAIAGRTASVHDWLKLLQPGPVPHHQVPAEVLNVAAQLAAREALVDTHPAECRVYVGAGRWASLRANRMESEVSGPTPPVAVTIQASTPAARLDMFARAFGLSPRQGELLWLTAAGADTAAMADAQGVTPYTIQDQFKQLFQTCGVHSRVSLLAMALGTGARA